MRKILLAGLPIAAILLGACSDKNEKEEIDNTPSSVVEIEDNEENITVGFVTAIGNGFIHVDFGGEFQLQYAIENQKIEIGTRVEMVHIGPIENKEFVDVLISTGEQVDNELKEEILDNKTNAIVYLDKEGNIIENIEEFKENIRKSKEEAELLEREKLMNEQKRDSEEVVEYYEKPKTDAYQEIKITYLGKADSRTVEAYVEGEFQILNVENDAVSTQLDKVGLEEEVTVVVFKSGSATIIHSVK